jgi:hypothetical protein
MTQIPDNESAPMLWERGANLPNRKGEYESQYHDLFTTLRDNRAVLERDVIDGRRVPATRVVDFAYTGSTVDSEPVTKTARAFAFLETTRNVFDEKETNIFLALDPDISDPAMFRLKLSPDGFMTKLADDFTELGEDLPDKSLVDRAISQLRNSLLIRMDERIEKRSRRNRKIISTVGSLAALAVVGGGTWLGLKHWVFDPRHREAAARSQYDAERHVLPGGHAKIDSTEISALSKAEFSQIPEMKEGDDLRSPRTIEILGNACTTLQVQYGAGDELSAAFRVGDPLLGSDFSVARGGSRELIVCVTGVESHDNDDSGTDDKSRLAIQIIE